MEMKIITHFVAVRKTLWSLFKEDFMPSKQFHDYMLIICDTVDGKKSGTI